MSDKRALEAVKAGDLEALRAAVRDQPSCAAARDEQGVSILLQAMYRGRRDMVDALLPAHGPLDVFEAVAVGRADLVRELLAADRSLAAAWSPDGFQSLHYAAWFGRREIAELLLDHGADPGVAARHAMGVAPLHSAVAGAHDELVGLLLDRGADPNARQHQGWTALQGAALHGRRDIVDRLLEHGADPSLRAENGKTAQDLATEGGHPDLAERLSAV